MTTVWKSVYPAEIEEFRLIGHPSTAIVRGRGFELTLGRPGPGDALAAFLAAWEIQIHDVNRETGAQLEFGRFRVEAWDEDAIIATVQCDSFEVAGREHATEPCTTGAAERLPLVRLFDHVGLALILPGPSGVRYSNQSGGYSCQHPEVEGVLVPLGNDLADNPVMLLGPEPDLHAFFSGPKHRGAGATGGIDVHDATEINAILGRHRLGGVLTVDLDRLRESHEAWIHVIVKAEPDDQAPVFTGFGPYPRAGILTWGNSD